MGKPKIQQETFWGKINPGISSVKWHNNLAGTLLPKVRGKARILRAKCFLVECFCHRCSSSNLSSNKPASPRVLLRRPKPKESLLNTMPKTHCRNFNNISSSSLLASKSAVKLQALPAHPLAIRFLNTLSSTKICSNNNKMKAKAWGNYPAPMLRQTCKVLAYLRAMGQHRKTNLALVGSTPQQTFISLTSLAILDMEELSNKQAFKPLLEALILNKFSS